MRNIIYNLAGRRRGNPPTFGNSINGSQEAGQSVFGLASGGRALERRDASRI